jgi:hypothetical protein
MQVGWDLTTTPRPFFCPPQAKDKKLQNASNDLQTKDQELKRSQQKLVANQVYTVIDS